MLVVNFSLKSGNYMSRIGKKIIAIPAKTEVTISGSKVTVKGAKGSLERTFSDLVSFKTADNTVTVSPVNETAAAVWGTAASHIVNMIEGVNTPFVKKLVLEGIGYKAEVKGTNLAMVLGYSHPVSMPIPAGLTVTSDKGIVTVSGIDKEAVGQFAAEIREWKKPEPYKGKGFHYEDETVRRKQGKKSA